MVDCQKPNIRKLVEQPYQQTKAETWDEVTETLCNLEFIQAKAAARLTYELVDDFNLVLQNIPDNVENIRKEQARQALLDKYAKDLVLYAKGEIKELEVPQSIKPWTEEQIDTEINRIKNNPNRLDKINSFYQYLGQQAGILQEHAWELQGLATQQAWNNYDCGPIGNSAEKVEPEKLSKIPLLNSSDRISWNPISPVKKILNGHSGWITCISISANGKVALTAGEDKKCILWNLERGNVLKVLEGHTDYIINVSLSANGETGLSVSLDKKIIQWDLCNGKPLNILKNDFDLIQSVNLIQGTNQIITISSENIVIWWNLETEMTIKSLKLVNEKNLKAASIASNGETVIATSSDFTSGTWSLVSGKKIMSFKGPSLSISTMALTSDGKFALSGSVEGICILWDAFNGNPLKTLIGHSNWVRAIAISSDGRLALSGSDDNTCILWNLGTGKPLKILSGHTKSVLAVSISNDGKIAISASKDKSCILWDLESGQALKTLNKHTSWITSLALSPDSSFVVSASRYNTIIWNILTGEMSILDEEIGTGINAISISQDSRQIILIKNGRTIFLWDFALKKKNKTLNSESIEITSALITADGDKAFISSKDKMCRLWDLKNLNFLNTFYGHKDIIYDVGITPEMKIALSVSADQTGIAWDLINQRILDVLNGHSGPVFSVALSHDGKYAFTGSMDNTCILWDLRTGQAVKTLKGHSSSVFKVALTSDCKIGMSASHDNNFIMWDLESGNVLKQFKSQTDFNHFVVTPDGKELYFTKGSSCVIWDMEKGYMNHPVKENFSRIDSLFLLTYDKHVLYFSFINNTFFLLNIASGVVIKQFSGPSDYIKSTCVTKDGKVALSASSEGTCFLWDINSGSKIKNLVGHNSRVLNIVFTPDERHALSVDQDYCYILWDLERGTPLRKLDLSDKKSILFELKELTLTHDGRQSIIFSSDDSCLLWDLETGEIIKKFNGASRRNLSLITPDGLVLILVSFKKILLFELFTGKIINTLEVNDYIEDIVLSPDGRMLVSRCIGAYIFTLWNLQTGKPVNIFNGHTDRINSIRFSYDGNMVLTTSFDNTMAIWDIETSKKIVQFFGNEEINCFDFKGRTLILGGNTLNILNMQGLSIFNSVEIANIRCDWDFKKRVYQKPTSCCPACGVSFKPAKDILGYVKQIRKEVGLKLGQSPCLNLPKEAWNEPDLLSSCPACGEKLKFNPFISGGLTFKPWWKFWKI